jgi:pimeloyl-ACP methyl ester carboxylesterase
VWLYVGHISGTADVRRIRGVRALAVGPRPFVVVDPRGIGRTMAQTCHCTRFFAPYGSDYLYATTGEMLGESYLGRRVYDVLRTMDFLRAGGATDIRLMGRGMGAVIALFAGLLHPSEPKIRLMHYLPSYGLVAAAPQYLWPLSSLLRGCLRHFDLLDVYRALGRRLTLSQPWNEWMEPQRRR